MTFFQAQSLCKSKGYELVKIDSDQFNMAIYNLVVKYGIGKYWIDANDVEFEGKFVYSDRKPITYNKFQPGEPNNYQNNEDCVHGLYYPNGFWNDMRCDDPNAVICYKNLQSTVSTSYEVSISNKNLLIIQDKHTFAAAQSLCKSKGYQLVRITNDNFNTAVFNLAAQYKIERYWIDANDIESEGNFVYSDGRKISYSKFYPGEPNNYGNIENCVHELNYLNSLWNDIRCDDLNSVICFKETEPKISTAIDITNKRLTVFQEKMTFEEAHSLCKRKGLELIKIDDDALNTVIYNLAVQYHIGRYWIDANDIKTEGSFEYLNGEKIKYSKFQSGEPNNYENEDCVHGMFYSNGFWNDIKCNDQNAVICYKQIQKEKSKVYKLLNWEILIIGEKATYQKSLSLCKDQGYQLIKIDDDQLNTMIYNLALKERLGRYWIDANDIEKEGNFVSSDGKKVIYTKFAPGEPNNFEKIENCVHGLFYPNALWNDFRCDDLNAVICYKTSAIERLKTITESNKELVIFKQKLTYENAQSLCKSQGYKLVKIDNDQFNMFIYNLAVENKIGRYWIDANDIKIEGRFEGSDGNGITYSKFANGEPNNYQNEDCVHGLYYTNGLWNDIKCLDLNAVICYKDIGSSGLTKIEINNREIIIFEEKMIFSHAQSLCKSKGYELVKIDNEQLNTIIYDLAVKYNIGTYWIDANDIQNENIFVYSDSKKITYNKWAPGEPNNYENEDCVHGLYYKNGLWNDIKCDYKNSVICLKEISNSNKTINEEERYHVHEVLVTYEEAIDFCNKHNCRIVKISNEETNKIVFEWVKKLNIGKYWINGNDIVKEGKWVDSNGNPLIYFNWEKNEPNNNNNEDCLHGNFYPNGKWNDISCNSKNYLIYEYEKKAEKEITIEILEGKFHYYRALELCKNKGLNLIRIENEGTNKMVNDFAIKNKIGTYWIDANDIKVEGTFTYYDGRNLTYSNFYHGEPNNRNNEDCVHGLYYPDGYWNDISCDNMNAVLCYKEFKEENVDNKGNITVDISKYFVHTGKVTYEGALRYCQINNCRLVTVINSEIDILIRNLVKKYNIGGYWLDGNDIKKEGEWVDFEGKKLTYFNWHQGEPNNYKNEDCLMGNYYSDGKWNDISCLRKYAFVYYYLEKSISNTELEIFQQRVTFEEAQNACKSKGWSLIRIDNEETNQKIYELAVKNKIGQYWIDANDKAVEGKFVDSNDNPLKYSKFPRGEPNNYGNEDCVHGLYYSNGFWNDISCSSKNSFICTKYSPPTIFIDEHTSFKIYIDKVTYKEALEKCQADGFSLIRIENSDTSLIVHDLSVRYKLGNYWIDGFDAKNDGKWLFSDGTTIKFQNWLKNAKNNKDENCIYSKESLNGKWQTSTCNSKHSTICYKPSKEITSGKVVKKTKYYVHKIGVTFQEALEFCKEKHCRLIVIDNIDLDKYLLELSKEINIETYWLNGNDRDNEGLWIDSDGKKLTYFNWFSGKVTIQKTQNCLLGKSDGKWRDVPCNDKHPFFFEFIDEEELECEKSNKN